ncbi:MAG: PIN domain-containing protein [Planctomycetes bacterium]|nr:PIN domain-containing protein [Planctomycetota bacterium]
MNLLFVDTGAFYALADRRDPAHLRAREFYKSYEGSFVTTDFVFAETMSLLTKRLGKKPAVAFGSGIRLSARFRIEDVPVDIRETGWKIFSGRLDKEHDLIDCISFALMESMELRQAFGFDKHFLQHGLRLLP